MYSIVIRMPRRYNKLVRIPEKGLCVLSLQYFKRDSYIVRRMSGLSNYQWKAEVLIAVAHLALLGVN